MIEVLDSLSGVPAHAWNRLAGNDPFLRHEFFSALHDTGCACPDSGWTPQFLVLREKNALAGALPLYLKTHSYGEYVFDWTWAEAYHRSGRRYYPKLLSSVPFSPVTGRRLLAETRAQRLQLISAAIALARKLNVSSWHCLFPSAGEAQDLEAEGLLMRSGVQFHWANHDYRDFEEFLADLTRDKRKKIRQERRKLRDQDISFAQLAGDEIAEYQWAFFMRCYENTYRRHYSTPYLNLDFFQRLSATMPGNVLLVIASRGGRPVASALNLHNGSTLYGRYWGAVDYVPGLHFETCYYQAIDYCIAMKLAGFEGGAQGEHKLARGFVPVKTRSAHWLAHPEFASAVEDYLAREAAGVGHYIDELNEHAPFRQK